MQNKERSILMDFSLVVDVSISNGWRGPSSSTKAARKDFQIIFPFSRRCGWHSRFPSGENGHRESFLISLYSENKSDVSSARALDMPLLGYRPSTS